MSSEGRLQHSGGSTRLAERTFRKSVAKMTGIHGFFSGKYEARSRSESVTRTSLCCESTERCRVEDLRSACKLNDHLKELSFNDCAGLSAFMTVTRFDRVGSRVMEKGDRATFLSLILSGKLSIKLPGPGGKKRTVDEPPPPILLGPGSLVGEMSYFEGGARNADVDCGEAPCVLAILPYAELDGDARSGAAKGRVSRTVLERLL